MNDWNVAVIRDLMMEAGRIAMKHFERPEIATKGDHSIVTAADHEVEAYLRGRLAPPDGEATFIGEESVTGTTAVEVARALTGHTWVVDPIDGTAPYANGLPNWGVSLGLMEHGTFTHGALFLPRIGELFITSDDRVLYERGSRDQDYWRFDRLAPLEPREIPYRRTGMVSLPSEVMYRASFDGGNPVQSIGSAVYSVAKVVSGSYLCYVARVKIWDIAAAIPILSRLGFRIEREDGTLLPARVSETDWVLDADSPRLWKSTGLLYVGYAPQTLTHVRTNFHPRKAR